MIILIKKEVWDMPLCEFHVKYRPGDIAIDNEVLLN
jgi:hypothetical protein